MSVGSGILADLVLDEEELRVVCQIIEAAVWFVTAEDMNINMAALE